MRPCPERRHLHRRSAKSAEPWSLTCRPTCRRTTRIGVAKNATSISRRGSSGAGIESRSTRQRTTTSGCAKSAGRRVRPRSTSTDTDLKYTVGCQFVMLMVETIYADTKAILVFFDSSEPSFIKVEKNCWQVERRHWSHGKALTLLSFKNDLRKAIIFTSTVCDAHGRFLVPKYEKSLFLVYLLLLQLNPRVLCGRNRTTSRRGVQMRDVQHHLVRQGPIRRPSELPHRRHAVPVSSLRLCDLGPRVAQLAHEEGPRAEP